MTSTRKTALGTTLSVLAIVVFSTIELNCKWLARALADAGAAPIGGFLLCFQRFFIAGLILLALFYPPFHRSGKRLTRRDLGIFLLNAVIGITIAMSFYQFGVARFENASSAAVVFSSNALFTIFFARFINGEEWTLRKWLSVAVGLCGIGCFFFENGAPSMDSLWSLLLMWASAMGFACSVCITRRVVADYGPGLLMAFTSLFGSILVLPLAIAFSEPASWTSCAAAWTPFTLLVLGGTALGYCLYYGSMKYISAYLASMSFMLKPVLACLMATLLAGEHMNPWTITGTILIMGSLLVSQLCLGHRQESKKEGGASFGACGALPRR